MPHDAPHDFVFYAPDLTADSNNITLDGDEHRHASRVLRMKAGDALYVTNGTGLMVSATIATIDKASTVVSVGESVPMPSGAQCRLAVALLKKDAFELVVRQATEAGVCRITPFVAEKSHLKEYGATFQERLRRIALAAMKQSFRTVLPVIDAPIPFDALADTLRGYAVTVADADGSDPVAQGSATAGVVGPEGGFSPAEIEALRAAGYAFSSISPHRLRAETAAVLMVAALNPPRGL